MGYALTALALVVGLTVFATKYIVVFGGLTRKEALVTLARVSLSIAAVAVLVVPLDYCKEWAYELQEALPAAFLVAVAEVFGEACRNKCGIAASWVAMLYALIHAEHKENSCGAGLFVTAVGGLIAGPVLWWYTGESVYTR